MKKSNKKLASLLLVFALVFVTGGVYASASGVLTFDGVAKLNESVITDELGVKIVSPYICKTTGNSTGTVTVSEDGQTMTMTAYLDKPGDTVGFGYKVKNTGTVDAYLGKCKIESPNGDDFNKAISANAPTYLENSVLKVDEMTGGCALYVTWKSDAEAYAGQEISYTFSIDYVDNNTRK